MNDLFGDIVKVTPSSKVVGDMALFLFTRGIKPADVVNLPPGTQLPGERHRHAHRRPRRTDGRLAAGGGQGRARHGQAEARRSPRR